MAEPSQHINYSFEDIQRYLQGKMPAAEMHELEKAALQDPFLADAIEGFNEADLNTASQHLNEINAGLFAEKQKTKLVSFNKRKQWLNIAALVIVLAGAGLTISFFIRPSSSTQQTEIAKTQQEAPKNGPVKDSAITTANTTALAKQPDTNLPAAENKAVKQAPPSAAKKKSENKKTPVAGNEVLNETEAESDSYKTEVASAAAPPREKTMMSRSYSTAFAPVVNADSLQASLQGKISGLSVLPAGFSGKVVDESNKPISGVSVVSADQKAAALTDVNGYFNLQKNDTLLHVTASTVGYDSRNQALRRGFNKPIVLKQNAALNDVVVIGYGAQQKSNITGSVLRKQKNIAGDSAMPVGGWQHFNHYVLTQLDKDTTASAITNPNDLVELEFLIDNSGNPYNIQVTRSPNDAHSIKAVEILKNGPKWTPPAHKEKTKVIISF
ncbi:carboxypeptidase-like regulatory domain-containing protein [Parafilimonas sp.]|uniref:carboxypeptidase-like regulatory domain-containing protein n=1 Tax=Parafilimonas sp. TaxID=1969739 RepID=UPI0039E4952C